MTGAASASESAYTTPSGHTGRPDDSAAMTRAAVLSILAVTLLAGLPGCSNKSAETGSSPATRIPSDSELSVYLESVAARVAATNPAQSSLLRLYDVDDVFSVALPDGSIAVSWGMLTMASNEAQFACMVGHELAHIRSGDVANGQAVDDAELLDGESRAGRRAHERDATREIEADRLGMDLCVEAGYDPLQLPKLLYVLAAFGEAVPKVGGPKTRVPEKARERVDAALAHIKDKHARWKGKVGYQDYLSSLKAYADSSGRTARPDEGNSTPDAGIPFGYDDGPDSSSACLEFTYDMMVNEDEGPNRGMIVDTNKWRAAQCDNRDVIPSNEFDAFGHCWIGCRATQLAGPDCALNLGTLREYQREYLDWELHDSFSQDIANQGIGRALAAARPEGSCYDMCASAYTSFDLTAPERRFFDCETGQNLPNRLGIGAQCHDTAEGTHAVKNDTNSSFFVKATADPESELVVTPTEPVRVASGDSIDVEVQRDCSCVCGEGKLIQESMTIDVLPDRMGSPPIKSFDVDVSTKCRRIDEKCGSAANEPHMRTFDGYRYDFQAVGEFVLVRSSDGDFELQVRQGNVTDIAAANSAIAMKAGGTRIAYYARLNNGSEGLYIDGTRVDGPVSRVLADGKSTITSTNFGYEVRLANGSRVSFTARWIVNVVVALRETKVSGLLGDANGDRSDDLQVPGGVPFERTDFDQLYGPFAERWRVTTAASLFDYPAGLSTDTYTNTDYPLQHVTLASLADDQRTQAEGICRDAGVPPSWFDDCVFDVAVTGDSMYAGNFGLSFAVGPDLVFTDDPVAGTALTVHWRGPGSPDDVIAIAMPDAPAGEYLLWRFASDGSPLTVAVPRAAGDYELRYLQDKSQEVLVSAPLTVVPANVELDSPDTVNAGGDFDVTWQGPDNVQDRLDIASIGAAPQENLSWQYVSGGSPTTMRAPDEPGSYDIRYVDGQSETVLATRAIAVEPVSATLDAPAMVAAGSQFEVAWEGPNNIHDELAVAMVGAAPRDKLYWQYVSGGSPVTMRAPDEPGIFEVRYLNGQSGSVLADRTIDVTPITATLEVSAVVAAGSSFEVAWKGPDNFQDRIAVVSADAGPGLQIYWRYTTAGSPLTLLAPKEPGAYEVRYVNGQSHGTLASSAITVE